MRALVKSKPEPGIWLEDISVPEIGHNDVLIKIAKTAVCGTDLHIVNWDPWAQATIPIGMQVGKPFSWPAGSRSGCRHAIRCSILSNGCVK